MIKLTNPTIDNNPWVNPIVETNMLSQDEDCSQKTVHTILEPRLTYLRAKYKLKYITKNAEIISTNESARQVPKKGVFMGQSLEAKDCIRHTMSVKPNNIK